MTPFLVSEIDTPPPWTEEGQPHAAAWYSAVHKRGPVAVDDASGALIYLGFDAVRSFLSEPGIWTLEKRLSGSKATTAIRLLSIDPPLHTQVREHFASAYRPKRIQAIEVALRTMARARARRCVELGTFDVVEDYIKPISVAGICELIGIPENGHDLMMVLNRVGSSVAPVRPLAAASLVEQLSVGSKMNGVEQVLPYFHTLIEEARREPRDDLVSALAAMPPMEAPQGVLDVATFLYEQFFAGTNTTVHTFTSMVLELNRHRDVLAQLREDRSLIKPLIEEVLRLHSPIQARPRVAAADTVQDGIEIREGGWGLGYISCANRDPAVFPDPDRLDIRRTGNLQMAFGRGAHFCIGMHLARMELRVAMEEWLDAIANFAPAEPAAAENWIKDFVLHGLMHYRVSVA